MVSSASLLPTLQHSDSFFPSGTVSFSWGIETLFSEGLVPDASSIETFIHAQLTNRWVSFDRGALTAAFEGSKDLDEVCRIDTIVEAQNMSSEARDGSHRAGMALLYIHEKIETPQAASYKSRIKKSVGYGNQNVMQGFLWAGCGISKKDAEIISAHGLCVGLLGAAIRLGAIGHVDSQRILGSLHQTIEHIVVHSPPPIGELYSFTPESEIAMMRHELAETRLFAN